MEIKFNKYHGTGNDFVILDQFKTALFDLNQEQIAFICDRRFGIGADGLMIIRPHESLDFEMVYYNSDGRQSSMCGNGGRCITMFAHSKGYIGDSCTFWAIDGAHKSICDGNSVSLEMSHISQLEKDGEALVIDTGSPHYVFESPLVEDQSAFIDKAKSIRYNDKYKQTGININAYQKLGPHKIKALTYERGVEDITLSCGTGVTAMAIVYGQRQDLDGQVEIEVENLGGNLSVQYTKVNNKISDVWLKGPAVFVFTGTIAITN